MLFNSYNFILLFLPICLVGYYLVLFLARETKYMPLLPKLWLTLMSLWFYGAFGINYLFWFVLDILLGYLIVKCMRIYGEKRKLVLVLGLLVHVGALLYFKYTGLFVSTINAIAGTDIVLADIILPLGISFFTFGQISYLVDTYRYLDFIAKTDREGAEFTPSKLVYEINDSFLDYVLFVTFFPKLLQGPIASYRYMKEQFDKIPSVRLSSEALMRGFILFTIGLFKKAILADTIGAGVDYGFENLVSLTNLDALITILGYTLQLYFDFSGYCDMGRGVCNMMGLDLPDNFYLPYQARNIEETWKKWHITLTAFFTRYLYIPMGGNRVGVGRMYLNLMIVFLVSGLWHGAGWNFVVWGFTQGALYLIYRLINGGKKKEAGKASLLAPLYILLNHLYWAFSFTFFRAESVSQALDMFGRVIQPFSGFHITYALADSFYLDEIWYVIKVTPLAKWTYAGYLCMWTVLAVSCLIIWGARKSAYEIAKTIELNKPLAILTGLIFVWGVLSLSGVSTYIYLSF